MFTVSDEAINLGKSYNLNLTEVSLLSIIQYLDNENHCTASNKYLCDRLFCSDRSLRNALLKLSDIGLIEIHKAQSKYRYIIFTAYSEKSSEYTRKNLPTTIYNNIYTESIDNKSDNKSSKNLQVTNLQLDSKDIYNKSLKEQSSFYDNFESYEKPLVRSMREVCYKLNSIKGRTLDDEIRNKMMFVAKTYADMYYKKIGKYHTVRHKSTMFNILNNLFDGNVSFFDLSESDIIDALKLYFDHKWDNCDYSISHFANPDIWIRRVKEMERNNNKKGFYGIGLWQIDVDIDKKDDWWKKGVDPHFWDDMLEETSNIVSFPQNNQHARSVI